MWIESADYDMPDGYELETNAPRKQMKPADFIKEHIRLIKVLTKGSKKEQKKEAADQKKELLKMLAKQK